MRVEKGCEGFGALFCGFWWFARVTLAFFRLKRGLNRRFQRCFEAVLGFLETIGVGGA